MSEMIKKMFDENVEDPEKSTGKKSAGKKKKTLLHSSEHNIAKFVSGGNFGYPDFFEFRDMYVKDEEILSTATDSTYSRTLNSVLKSVMNSPDWYEDMVVYDRDYALMWIWTQNYGAKKDLTVTCRNKECGHEETKTIDLSTLPFTKLNEKIQYPYEMELKSGDVVSIHMPTVADEMFAEEWCSKNKDDFETVLAARTIKLKQEPTFKRKLEWIRDNITALEYGKIRKYREFAWFGINPRIEHICTKCKEVTFGDIPFSPSDILWPTVHADIEEFLRPN